MEFTDANNGDRAIIHPQRLAVVSHLKTGIWLVRRLPDLSPWCTLHSGSADSVPVWHDHLPRILFYTADSVILFDLEGRNDEEEEERPPNMPDGVIKEARTVRIKQARFLPDNEHILVLLQNGLGGRVWSVRKRNEAVLSSSSTIFISNPHYHAIVIDKALYVLSSQDLHVVDKWRLPEGALLSVFVFMNPNHHSGKYGILAWQCEEELQVYAVDEGEQRGFQLIAQDETVFAVSESFVYDQDLLLLPDRTGSFTIMNVLTRHLVAQVNVGLQKVKNIDHLVVFRESRRVGSDNEETAWFDAGYGELLGAGSLARIDTHNQDIELTITANGRFAAIRHSLLTSLLFIYDLSVLSFRAVLFLSSPITSVAWCSPEEVLCTASNSRHIYSWQPAGARALPHPHGPVEAVEWREGWCVVRGKRSFSLAVMINE